MLTIRIRSTSGDRVVVEDLEGQLTATGLSKAEALCWFVWSSAEYDAEIAKELLDRGFVLVKVLGEDNLVAVRPGKHFWNSDIALPYPTP